MIGFRCLYVSKSCLHLFSILRNRTQLRHHAIPTNANIIINLWINLAVGCFHCFIKPGSQSPPIWKRYVVVHGVMTASRLTTQAQRPGPRDAMIANHDAMPGSLQRMVRPHQKQ